MSAPHQATPVEAIGRLLAHAMNEAAANGANSVSMPDDYVVIAAWLAQVSPGEQSTAGHPVMAEESGEPVGPLSLPIDRLVAIQKREIAAAKAAGQEFFLDLPDAWYEPRPTYGCENGHISHRYLKSEERGSLCLACQKPIALLPGHYTEESLSKALLCQGVSTASGGFHE